MWSSRKLQITAALSLIVAMGIRCSRMLMLLVFCMLLVGVFYFSQHLFYQVNSKNINTNNSNNEHFVPEVFTRAQTHIYYYGIFVIRVHLKLTLVEYTVYFKVLFVPHVVTVMLSKQVSVTNVINTSALKMGQLLAVISAGIINSTKDLLTCLTPSQRNDT